MQQNIYQIPRYFYLLSRKYGSKKESSFWGLFKKSEPIEEKPPLRQCKKKQGPRLDPDLSRFGGQAYRTCGRGAYIIQRDTIPTGDDQRSEEDIMLMRMEADLSNKDQICDPMPPFESVEQRMLDLTERKLHPYYRRYMALPKKDFVLGESPPAPFFPYKCHVGPVEPEEIPGKLRFNREMLEKKNIFSDFKRVELPRQMLARLLELEKNKRPTLEKKETKE